jgi:hypothetical protein|tara:strand:+ start:95 stop:907 length:813 start_codon:yes stop_codon:yes gene_type:complete
VYCNSCGAENPDQAQFCSKCGSGLTVDDVPVVPEAVPIVPSAGTAVAAPAPLHLTEEDHQTARVFAGLSLLLVLFSVFGGPGSSSWWIIHAGGPSNYDGEADNSSVRLDFGLRKMELADSDDSEDIRYSANKCGCDEIEDLMGTVELLGYLAILAAAFFVHSAFKQNDGRTLRNAALALGVIGLLTAVYFAMTWTDAFDEDTQFFDNVDGKSFFGTSQPDERTKEADDNTIDLTVEDDSEELSWKPWLGWGAMLLSGFLGIAYYATLEFD